MDDDTGAGISRVVAGRIASARNGLRRILGDNFDQRVCEETVAPAPSPTLLADDGEDFAILARGTFPEKAPANLGGAQGPIGANRKSRINRRRARVDLKVDTAKFKSDSLPIMSATIRYYNAQNLPNQ